MKIKDELQETRPTLMGRIFNAFGGHDDEDDMMEDMDVRPLKGSAPTIRLQHRYQVSVRRQIIAFEDAQAAADGLLNGEQQILNLTGTDPVLRTTIINFLSGVRYAQKAVWEDIGENIYLMAPCHAHVEVIPASPRMAAQRN